MNEDMIGIVEQGKFRRIWPSAGGPAQLTRIAAQAAQSPENAEVDLAEHEGRALMISGHDNGGWIYSANVIEAGGRLLTVVVKELLGTARGAE